MRGEFLTNTKGTVLQVHASRDNENERVDFGKKTGKTAQKWKIAYVDEQKKPLRKGDLNEQWGFRIGTSFHIQTAMASRRLLQTIGYDVQLKSRNGFKTQLFYFDNLTKSIRSRANHNYAMHIQNNGSAANLECRHFANKWWNRFKYVGQHIQSPYQTKVFDVYRGADEEG